MITGRAGSHEAVGFVEGDGACVLRLHFQTDGIGLGKTFDDLIEKHGSLTDQIGKVESDKAGDHR